MNKFLDDLKYNVNTTIHKAKKGLLVGGLSLMAATSFVGCSPNKNSTEQEQQQTKASQENIKKLSSEADKIIAKLDNYQQEQLSEQDDLDLINFLLSYTFEKTSQDYNGSITSSMIIPNIYNSTLDGSFSIPDDELKNDPSLYNYTNLHLNYDATELYNSYATSEKDLKQALISAYSAKVDLAEINPELLDDLSSDEMYDLLKSSYVCAYNNKNPDLESLNAANTNIHIYKTSDGKYDISSTKDVVNQEPVSLENSKDKENVLNDYTESCKYLKDGSNNSTVLQSLKYANSKNNVYSTDIAKQLAEIALEEKRNEHIAESSKDDSLDR